ncbi:MAG: penicillin-binding protein 2 [Pegethrix bostrychoides GSE-TBD4-15B]|uniref:Penicillin-binding protein 2 n=1 Tax=Pegethrix bostrychoides GSE-TBD4-15B TaxID=2839662 RepID=A0A951U706_9CYAN|nr:penicillin-binding protein 2 [Pegethrix bostrychoides GSE-TBD4-15B]
MAISFRPFQRPQKSSRRSQSARSQPMWRSSPARSARVRTRAASERREASDASDTTVIPLRRSRLSIASPRSRLLIVWLLIMAGMLALLINLLRLQVFDADMLQARAKAQQTVALSAAVPRRSIIDREGNVLAIDKPVYTLYAHPILFQQQKETIAVALAPLLKKPLDQMQQILSQGESGLRLADDLPEETANSLRRLELDGLELVPQQERLYPQQELFANIVGYVNVDRQGQAGLEYSQEEQLARPLPETEISRSGDGSVMPDGISKDFAQHDDLQLQLTLDSRLQRATRYALKQQTDKYGAKRGVAIVMDVQDGSILALAAEPSFDANKYYKTDLETLRDWVVTDVYEPGSTFKPINIAIALESGSVKPKDTFFDEGAIQIGEWPIQNSDYESAGGRGSLSVSQILQYSSNVGMVHVMQQLNPGIFYGWLEKLKLGEVTGIDLPFEAPGQVKKYTQFTSVRVEPATTAFGQGFSLTPIKLIQLHATLANGGKLVTPHVVKGLVNAEGQLKWQPDHPKPQQVFTPKTTQAVLEMMEQVVQEGTGAPAQIAGYRIAGKTGTAQKASQYGGYSRARITSFIGILPVEAPRYAVLAVVDEPQGDDAYGSTVSAPVVKSVMDALIATERIPPTQPEAVGSNDELSDLPSDLREAIDFRNQINHADSQLADSSEPPLGEANSSPTIADPAAIADGSDESLDEGLDDPDAAVNP